MAVDDPTRTRSIADEAGDVVVYVSQEILRTESFNVSSLLCMSLEIVGRHLEPDFVIDVRPIEAEGDDERLVQAQGIDNVGLDSGNLCYSPEPRTQCNNDDERTCLLLLP